MAQNNDYDSQSIQVLEGLEAVRKRPGMYIGNIDERGLHHLVWEIVDNSIDEHLAGFASKIDITIHKDQSITVEDNGRGIPTSKHEKTGLSALETVLTVLHAGGKFGGENSGYKVSGGLHGVGASVVNALSDKLIAEVKRDNKLYSVEYTEGGSESSGIQVKDIADSNSGTTITFYPSYHLFNEGVDEFKSEVVSERLKQSAYLNKGLLINFIDERNDIKQVFQFEDGLIDYIKDVNGNTETIFDEIIYSESTKDSINVEVAFQYIKPFKPRIYSYVNNIYTPEGGTHEQGFINAIKKTINHYVEENFSAKEKMKFTNEDIKDGLAAIISIKHPDPMFEGQTKNKLANIEVSKIVNDLVSEQFDEFLMENPTTASLIFAKLKQAANSRIAAQKAREKVRKESLNEFSTLPGKLADCSSKDVTRTEIFIVEGDSAGGSAKMGRNRETQAILPLKGKIMNAQKSRVDKLFSNDEVNAIITAVGAGIGDNFNLEKIRYGKIIIMTDADVDGSHIRTLLLTFFYRYMRELIINGNIFIAQPPLYKLTKGKTSVYLYSDNEKDKMLKEFDEGETTVRYSLQRYKGLGEMNDDQLWETTMDPENRKLLRVQIEDAILADKVFDNLMGDLVEPRKEFIIKNAKQANLDV